MTRCVFIFQVIKNLDPTKLNAGTPPDVFALRNQLHEKAQLISNLEVGGATCLVRCLPRWLSVGDIYRPRGSITVI